MAPDLSRRKFLLGRRLDVAVAEPVPADPWSGFFESYEQACAQVNEARPFLAEEARRLGISTEGKSDLEIVREVFASSGQPPG